MSGALKLDTERMIARKDGAIGWMVFNNPVRHNALSLDMWRAAATVIEAFQTDDQIRVAIMTGAGDKAFVSGADISEFETQRASAEAEKEYGRVTARAMAALAAFDRPLIAMIRGYCMGGGLAMALNADIRIAAEGAKFAIPASRLGVGYGFSGLKILTDLVGPAMAKEILFSSRRLSDSEALRIGLVNRVVPPEVLEEEVRDLAETIAGNAPLTIQAAKAAVGEVLKDPDRRDLAKIEAMVRACFDSADYTEGRRAFMEKRKPVFQGR
ncbi:MAG: enoyl-CoA hydratase [Alphaproteobacteria bacterium]|jgi:enoyl-CoA hydratase/carnithine racemase|nr:enoyl-CoA hydratase [Alphaproteobacteria bacterium]MDP6517915.1 enoyl-CoA hydratase [Alphaproteobacteria bacterium]|tara:strand:- start:96 stop:902 length:807 start_codon:yes stop_codon:yes gene_type:complete